MQVPEGPEIPGTVSKTPNQVAADDTAYSTTGSLWRSAQQKITMPVRMSRRNNASLRHQKQFSGQPLAIGDLVSLRTTEADAYVATQQRVLNASTELVVLQDSHIMKPFANSAVFEVCPTVDDDVSAVGQTITYGSAFELRHWGEDSPMMMDPDCLSSTSAKPGKVHLRSRASLDERPDSAVSKIVCTPQIASRKSGDTVRSGDDVALSFRFGPHRGMYLHVSSRANAQNRPQELDQAKFEDFQSRNNQFKTLCGNTEPFAFKLLLFQKSGRLSQGLHIGESIRLFQWKAGYICTTRGPIGNQIDVGPKAISGHVDHEPNAAQIFVVENPDSSSRAWGGPLYSGDCFRLRHLATDSFLGIKRSPHGSEQLGSSPSPLDSSDGEMDCTDGYRISFCQDTVEGMTESIFRFVNPRLLPGQHDSRLMLEDLDVLELQVLCDPALEAVRLLTSIASILQAHAEQDNEDEVTQHKQLILHLDPGNIGHINSREFITRMKSYGPFRMLDLADDDWILLATVLSEQGVINVNRIESSLCATPTVIEESRLAHLRETFFKLPATVRIGCESELQALRHHRQSFHEDQAFKVEVHSESKGMLLRPISIAIDFVKSLSYHLRCITERLRRQLGSKQLNFEDIPCKDCAKALDQLAQFCDSEYHDQNAALGSVQEHQEMLMDNGVGATCVQLIAALEDLHSAGTNLFDFLGEKTWRLLANICKPDHSALQLRSDCAKDVLKEFRDNRFMDQFVMSPIPAICFEAAFEHADIVMNVENDSDFFRALLRSVFRGILKPATSSGVAKPIKHYSPRLAQLLINLQCWYDRQRHTYNCWERATAMVLEEAATTEFQGVFPRVKLSAGALEMDIRSCDDKLMTLNLQGSDDDENAVARVKERYRKYLAFVLELFAEVASSSFHDFELIEQIKSFVRDEMLPEKHDLLEYINGGHQHTASHGSSSTVHARQSSTSHHFVHITTHSDAMDGTEGLGFKVDDDGTVLTGLLSFRNAKTVDCTTEIASEVSTEEGCAGIRAAITRIYVWLHDQRDVSALTREKTRSVSGEWAVKPAQSLRLLKSNRERLRTACQAHTLQSLSDRASSHDRDLYPPREHGGRYKSTEVFGTLVSKVSQLAKSFPGAAASNRTDNVTVDDELIRFESLGRASTVESDITSSSISHQLSDPLPRNTENVLDLRFACALLNSIRSLLENEVGMLPSNEDVLGREIKSREAKLLALETNVCEVLSHFCNVTDLEHLSQRKQKAQQSLKATRLHRSKLEAKIGVEEGKLSRTDSVRLQTTLGERHKKLSLLKLQEMQMEERLLNIREEKRYCIEACKLLCETAKVRTILLQTKFARLFQYGDELDGCVPLCGKTAEHVFRQLMRWNQNTDIRHAVIGSPMARLCQADNDVIRQWALRTLHEQFEWRDYLLANLDSLVYIPQEFREQALHADVEDAWANVEQLWKARGFAEHATSDSGMNVAFQQNVTQCTSGMRHLHEVLERGGLVAKQLCGASGIYSQLLELLMHAPDDSHSYELCVLVLDVLALCCDTNPDGQRLVRRHDRFVNVVKKFLSHSCEGNDCTQNAVNLVKKAYGSAHDQSFSDIEAAIDIVNEAIWVCTHASSDFQHRGRLAEMLIEVICPGGHRADRVILHHLSSRIVGNYIFLDHEFFCPHKVLALPSNEDLEQRNWNHRADHHVAVLRLLIVLASTLKHEVAGKLRQMFPLGQMAKLLQLILDPQQLSFDDSTTREGATEPTSGKCAKFTVAYLDLAAELYCRPIQAGLPFAKLYLHEDPRAPLDALHGLLDLLNYALSIIPVSLDEIKQALHKKRRATAYNIAPRKTHHGNESGKSFSAASPEYVVLTTAEASESDNTHDIVQLQDKLDDENTDELQKASLRFVVAFDSSSIMQSLIDSKESDRYINHRQVAKLHKGFVDTWGGNQDRMTDNRKWLVHMARKDVHQHCGKYSIDFRSASWPEQKVDCFDKFKAMAHIVWGRRGHQWLAHQALLLRNGDDCSKQGDFIHDFEEIVGHGWWKRSLDCRKTHIYDRFTLQRILLQSWDHNWNEPQTDSASVSIQISANPEPLVRNMLVQEPNHDAIDERTADVTLSSMIAALLLSATERATETRKSTSLGSFELPDAAWDTIQLTCAPSPELQMRMTKWGAIDAVLHLLSTDHSLNIVSKAAALGICILEGPNKDAQEKFFERELFDEQDNADGSHSSSGFLTNVCNILNVLDGTDAGNQNLRVLADTNLFHRNRAVCRVLRLLQLLCEDHYRSWQDCLRRQPVSESVDVVRVCGNFLYTRATQQMNDFPTVWSSTNRFGISNEADDFHHAPKDLLKWGLQILRQACNTIGEVCQGPNLENQKLLVSIEVGDGDAIVAFAPRLLWWLAQQQLCRYQILENTTDTHAEDGCRSMDVLLNAERVDIWEEIKLLLDCETCVVRMLLSITEGGNSHVIGKLSEQLVRSMDNVTDCPAEIGSGLGAMIANMHRWGGWLIAKQDLLKKSWRQSLVHSTNLVERHGVFKTVTSLVMPLKMASVFGVDDLEQPSILLGAPYNAILHDAQDDVSEKSSRTCWSETGAKRVSLTHGYFILLETINLNEATSHKARLEIKTWRRTTKLNQIILHLGESRPQAATSMRVLNKDDVFGQLKSAVLSIEIKNLEGELETVFFPAPATCVNTENRQFVVKRMDTMMTELRMIDARNVRQRLEQLAIKSREFVSLHNRQQKYEMSGWRILQWCGNQISSWTMWNTVIIHIYILSSDLTLNPQSRELGLGSTGGNVTQDSNEGPLLDWSRLSIVDWLAVLHVLTSALKVMVYVLEGPLDQFRSGIQQRLEQVNMKKVAIAKKEVCIRPKRARSIPSEVAQASRPKSICRCLCTSTCCRFDHSDGKSLIETHLRSVCGDDSVESVMLEQNKDGRVKCATVQLKSEAAATHAFMLLRDLFRANSYQLINSPATIRKCTSDEELRLNPDTNFPERRARVCCRGPTTRHTQQLVTVDKKTARAKGGAFISSFFQRVDRDSSKTISFEELSSAMRYDLNMQLTDDEVLECFNALDRSENGSVHDQCLEEKELQHIFFGEPVEVRVSRTLDHEIKIEKELKWWEWLWALRHLLTRESAAETLWTIYHLCYIYFSILGCLSDRLYFTYHLAELFILIPAGKDLVDTVASNWRQLFVTLFLGFVITYIYAVVGWFFIHNDQTGFVYGFGEQPDWDVPTTFASWIVIHLDQGMRDGPVRMDHNHAHGNNEPFAFVALSISYFIIVVLVVGAVVSGIVLDAFAAKREQAERIENDIDTVDFVSGLTRSQFEEVPGMGAIFDKTRNRLHNIRHYFYFTVHLDQKPASDFTGQESYVRDMLSMRDMEVFPINRCSVLDRARAQRQRVGADAADHRDGSAKVVVTRSAASSGSGQHMCSMPDDAHATARDSDRSITHIKDGVRGNKRSEIGRDISSKSRVGNSGLYQTGHQDSYSTECVSLNALEEKMSRKFREQRQLLNLHERQSESVLVHAAKVDTVVDNMVTPGSAGSPPSLGRE